MLVLMAMGARRDTRAADLSYGELRYLEIALALMTAPDVLLLDEAAAGLAPQEADRLRDIILRLREAGRTIVLIEHNMSLVMSGCHRVVVLLNFGEVIADGPAAAVQADVRVMEVYLGGEPLLSLRRVDVHYGRVQALRDIDLDVAAGEVVALLGANGAGKSTTLPSHLRNRQAERRGAEIRFKGRPTGHMSSHQIAAAGIGHVPEGRQLFAEMSVSDNLHVGAFRAQDVARRRDSVLEHFPRLGERIGQQAGTLSGGEQQMLAIARVLMAEPDLLMFDEPSMGLSPIMVESVASIIRCDPLRVGASHRAAG